LRGAILRYAKRIGQQLPYWASLLLAAAFIPLLRKLNLPVAFDWSRLISLYWLVLAAQAIFLATLLLVLADPALARMFFQSLWRQKLRIVFIVLYFGILFWATSWGKALVLTVDAIAILEFLQAGQASAQREKMLGVLAPAVLLFFGFLLVFAYNDIIASVRFFGERDSFFNSIDTWLMHGNSVSSISHWAVGVFSLRVFRFLEFIYFGMFPQVGAALLICSLCYGKRRGMQFVATILTAYYTALGLFYIWPSHGPYWLCSTHFSVFPSKLQTFLAQKQLLANAQGLWDHTRRAAISTDYFIAFPCMHIAQPLIAMWFLRQWKRMVLALAIYDALLVIAILFLEWHYLIDILASLPVAAGAIACADGGGVWRWLTGQEKAL
jgi:hypothetical protein